MVMVTVMSDLRCGRVAACTFLREPVRVSANQKTKTRRKAGSEKTCVTRDSYPAGCGIVGRRARDVMPAAMRALVRIETLAERWNIRREGRWLSGRLNDGTEVLRNATTAVAARAVERYSAGVTLMRTRIRSPGS
jgi:hypothetical protein